MYMQNKTCIFTKEEFLKYYVSMRMKKKELKRLKSVFRLSMENKELRVLTFLEN